MKTLWTVRFVLGMLFIAGQASATTRYVDIDNLSPSGAYTNWGSAATNIQAALDIADIGDTILVADGLYSLSSGLVISNEVTLQSVNGPEAAVIDGNGLVRCISIAHQYRTNDTVISGFTIQNGYSSSFGAGIDGAPHLTFYADHQIISNCVIQGNVSALNAGGVRGCYLYDCSILNNTASEYGGGTYDSSLSDCIISGNSVTNWSVPNSAGGIFRGIATRCVISSNTAQYGSGGGTYQTTVSDSILFDNHADFGGGMYFGTANRCTIRNNSAGQGGGGAYGTTVNNSLILNNASPYYDGGGMVHGEVNNCTIVGNTAKRWGGGMYAGTAHNSILLNNTALIAGNNNYLGTQQHCSSPDFVSGVNGNITNAPDFMNEAADDYRLSPDSACIDAGFNDWAVGSQDLGGAIRIFNGTVDLGAYEWLDFSEPIKNLTVLQRPGDKVVDIYYDLATNATISLVISNGLASVDVLSVAGDAGAGVSAGVSNHAVWIASWDWYGKIAELSYTLIAENGSGMLIDQKQLQVLTDTREYILEVSSPNGSPDPVAGPHYLSWMSEVSGSVEQTVTVDGTNYTCIGWHGTGSVPALGLSTNTGPITLTELSSSIEWRWIVDADSDRMPDDWELLYYGSSTGAVASVDTDGDGYNAWQEYILGSNPTNGGSSFLFTPGTNPPPGEFNVDFTTVTGRLYTVECTDELGSGNWQVLTNFIGDGSAVQIIDPANIPACFYQIQIDWAE